MGVTSCGKSTVASAAAKRIDGQFIEADDLHPQANINKMQRGTPLTDADRWPWLSVVGDALAASGTPALVSCSALKRAYRDVIRERVRGNVSFIQLDVSRDVLHERMSARTGHFMPLSLLDSQLEAFEPLELDETGIVLAANQPLEATVEATVRYLQSCG